MQIRRLVIDNYKCLVDFCINFETEENVSCTVLIGENGTGKSTMLEAIALIFMAFDSPSIEKSIMFSYEIEYKYAGQHIVIVGHEKRYHITVDRFYSCMGSRETVLAQLEADGRSIFPKRFIAYYSGANDKFQPLFSRMNRPHNKLSRDTIREYISHINNPQEYFETPFPRRKYNYCNENLTGIYLCSILGGQDTYEKQYLQEHCKFRSIADIDVEVDLKPVFQFYNKTNYDEDWLIEKLTTILEFIDSRMARAFNNGFSYTDNNKAYFSLSDIPGLDMDTGALYDFFEKLATLFSAKYAAYVYYGETRVNANDLSEGQRQLIKLLGMLGVCKNEDCLVLLDEPDAHMNPKWKYEIKTVIEESLKDAISTQAIIATHDPLVINGVDKRFIRIFEYNKAIIENNDFYFTKVITPEEDTEGLGIDGLLQSGYYGLQTSYDKATTEKYLERQQLYIKLINQEINEEEKEQLKELTAELGSLPISYNTIDFLYDDFINVFQHSEFYIKPYLNYDQIKERRQKIKDIITKLFER